MTRWSFLKEASEPARKEPKAQPRSSGPEPDHLDYRFTGWVRENERVSDLRTWAFRYAGASNGSPEVLRTIIGWVYNNKVTVDDAHAQREQERLRELSEESAQ